jgi:hypothetical protein
MTTTYLDGEIGVFLRRFVGTYPPLRQELEKQIAEWAPEAPPVTCLFGDFGDVIRDNYASVDPDEVRRWFACIEQGVNSGNEVLIAALATGLIEVLVNSHYGKPNWSEMEALLGPESLRYAIAWGEADFGPVRS